MTRIIGDSGRPAVMKGMKAEREYISSMSHDFRTPLGIIIGFTELLLDEVPGKINEDQRRSLNDILDSARRLLGIVDGMPENR